MVKAIATDSIRSTETRIFNGNGCPLEWLWDRVDDYNGTARDPKSFFLRGTVGHEMIETHITTEDTTAALMVLAEFLESPVMDVDWIETTKCNKEGFEVELVGLYSKWLKQYQTYYLNNEIEIVATEYELDFTTPNGTRVVTTLDALAKDEDEHPIVLDWKLGTSKSGKDMQLYVYWYGLRRGGHIPDDQWFRGWFHYVTYENPIGYTQGEYPGDKFVEAYIDNADRNRKSGPYLPNPDWFDCRYCHHREVCPLYEGNHNEGNNWPLIQEIELEFV